MTSVKDELSTFILAVQKYAAAAGCEAKMVGVLVRRDNMISDVAWIVADEIRMNPGKMDSFAKMRVDACLANMDRNQRAFEKGIQHHDPSAD